ncbi:unnamed protein product [Fraxinus pennsylvanica]|uniref:inorganic diphosphatase n=1 Tax=Fraxinus pennsylvanica TaxID=56036 RepID=A0AAD1Z7N0_9LAMI|nr:unnamed protein product [Fraxinus pennsylvanica]
MGTPSLANPEVEETFGDNDPDNCTPVNLSVALSFGVDAVEIGEFRAKSGQILKVKPFAALAMNDEGELDWKIVAISVDDPKASLVKDTSDVEKHFPIVRLRLQRRRSVFILAKYLFRDYKIPDGKPANKFGLGNKPANKDYALEVITETNESWAKLFERSIPAGELSLV